jgi:DNA-directed RNA polymerase subunit RPC12/RpoP
MSEFKYACPVCGQHIKCDSAQAGSVMDCPTCFQKITVPQAPASEDQKFILTGSKVTEKKTSVPVDAGGGVAPEKKFPVAIALVLLLVVCAAGAAVYVFRGKIFKPEKAPPPKSVAVTNAAPPRPKIIAPPASDMNWMLTLGTNAIPDAPVAGRIHGQDFIVERASFQNGSLTLRAGRGPLEFGCTINFAGAQSEALSGKNLNILADTNKSARVTLRWKDADGTVQKENYEDSYALRLEFGALTNSRLPGKIYLCTPDAEKSYLMGAFNADARKPKPKPPKK